MLYSARTILYHPFQTYEFHCLYKRKRIKPIIYSSPHKSQNHLPIPPTTPSIPLLYEQVYCQEGRRHDIYCFSMCCLLISNQVGLKQGSKHSQPKSLCLSKHRERNLPVNCSFIVLLLLHNLFFPL